MSALVREFLSGIGETERQKELLHEAIESIRETNPNFSAEDRLSRDAVHDRDAFRREHESAMRHKPKTIERG